MQYNIQENIESTRRELASLVEAFGKEGKEFKTYQSEYVALLQRQTSMTQKLHELSAEVESSTLEFKKEFAAHHYERTPAVKKVLHQKNDAQDMFEEIEIALQKVKRQVLSMQMDAGPKAREAFHIHCNMKRNYVKLKMLEAMAAVPQEFSNALALAVTYFGKDNQMDFVLQGLLSQAKETGEKEDLPFEDFSVAPFTQSDFNWTPVQIRNANKALEDGANLNSMKPQRPAHGSFAAKYLIPGV